MTTPIVHTTLEAQKARTGKMRGTPCTMVGPLRLKHIGAATEGQSTRFWKGNPKPPSGWRQGSAGPALYAFLVASRVVHRAYARDRGSEESGRGS